MIGGYPNIVSCPASCRKADVVCFTVRRIYHEDLVMDDHVCARGGDN